MQAFIRTEQELKRGEEDLLGQPPCRCESVVQAGAALLDQVLQGHPCGVLWLVSCAYGNRSDRGGIEQLRYVVDPPEPAEDGGHGGPECEKR